MIFACSTTATYTGPLRGWRALAGAGLITATAVSGRVQGIETGPDRSGLGDEALCISAFLLAGTATKPILDAQSDGIENAATLE